MGLFSYHRLGKIKEAQRDNARQSRILASLQKKQLEEQKKQENERKQEIKEQNAERRQHDIGHVRINIYNYLKKLGLTNIKVDINYSATISANSSAHKDKSFFVDVFNNINNQLYLIDRYTLQDNVILYSNNTKILINDGKKIIFGSNNIINYLRDKRNKLHERQKEIAHKKALKLKKHNENITKLKKIGTYISIILFSSIAFIWYVIILIKNYVTNTNKSVWSTKQIIIIIIISFLITSLPIIAGSF